MKLYTYTRERSLARMALKGIPESFPMWGSLVDAAATSEMDQEPNDRMVVLEVDVDGIEDTIIVTGERVEEVATMAQEEVDSDSEIEEGPEKDKAAEKAYTDVYDSAENLSGLQDMIEKFDVVENSEEISPSRVKVLGVPKVEYTDATEEELEVTFEEPPKPLKVYKQPVVTRLLRSIFLPKHKLYGAGKRHRPVMGLISRFIPKVEEEEVAAPPPDVVSGVPLVWAAGKTFRRGMRGAFGEEAGDAIAQLVAMRAGQEPGRYLGSGAKGAVYTLGKNRVIKVTMDGSEVFAAKHLIGVRHPNLSQVHDVFVVTDGEKGAGFIVRDAVDTNLKKFDPAAARELDYVMNLALLVVDEESGESDTFQDMDPEILARGLESSIDFLRDSGCKLDENVLLNLADAFRQLRYLGIVGIDFDSRNIGVIKKPEPRVVIFDYGMTKSPPVEVEVVSLESSRR